MGKRSKRVREDEIWCPECGAPIKKGFLTCSNCKFKARMTREINREQDKKESPEPEEDAEAEGTGTDIMGGKAEGRVKKESGGLIPGNPLSESGHPRYWSY